jgi:hypothetical protein
VVAVAVGMHVVTLSHAYVSHFFGHGFARMNTDQSGNNG